MQNQTGDTGHTTVLSDFLTIEQAAAELNVAKRTISRWLTLSLAPPSLKIGNHRYFRRAAIIQWLTKKETTRVASAGGGDVMHEWNVNAENGGNGCALNRWERFLGPFGCGKL